MMNLRRAVRQHRDGLEGRGVPLHWVVGSLVAAMLLLACGCSTYENPIDAKSTPLAPIQRQPVPIADDAMVRRGEIVAVKDPAEVVPELDGVAGAVVRAVYRSTSGVTGQSTEVSGIFALPRTPPPDGGWPVISLGHGTTGVDHGCGPSMRPDLMGDASTVASLLSRGYAVAMTDYEGLDNTALHPYLEPWTAAHNVIDAVRAIRSLFPDVSLRWAAAGGSQGGQAAWAANELNSGYGQGLDLVGSVALSPAVNVTALADLAFRNELTPEQIGAMPLLVVGLVRGGLLDRESAYLRGNVVAYREVILGCDSISGGARSLIRSEEVAPESPAAMQSLARALQKIALPQQPLSAPMLVVNGKRDQIIAPSWVSLAVDSSCRLGGEIEHLELPKAGHAHGWPLKTVEEWLKRRFAGAAAESNCPR